jgi:acetyl esterase/lipase
MQGLYFPVSSSFFIELLDLFYRKDLFMSVTPFTIVYGPAPQQFAELYLPPGTEPFRVVLLIHGGFWRAPYDLSLMAGLAQDLVSRNFAVWNVEYRRIGDPGGGWPGTFQDLAQGADFLYSLAATYNLDLKHVVAIGHSAGGQLGLWLATRHRLPSSEITIGTQPLSLTGVISLAGANDLEQVWQLHLGGDAAIALLGGSPEEYPLRYQLASPAAQLPLGIPQTLIHGDADNRVPLIVSQDYATHATQAGDRIRLIELLGADHFDLIDPGTSAWSITVAELEAFFNGLEWTLSRSV